MKKVREVSSVVWELLEGKKTYIGTVITFIAGGLYFVKAIDEETAKWLAGFGALVMSIGFRSAIQKAIEK
jgi:hypothetical protein